MRSDKDQLLRAAHIEISRGMAALEVHPLAICKFEPVALKYWRDFEKSVLGLCLALERNSFEPDVAAIKRLDAMMDAVDEYTVTESESDELTADLLDEGKLYVASKLSKFLADISLMVSTACSVEPEIKNPWARVVDVSATFTMYCTESRPDVQARIAPFMAQARKLTQ